MYINALLQNPLPAKDSLAHWQIKFEIQIRILYDIVEPSYNLYHSLTASHSNSI